jgi:hypothetical protein
MPANQVICRFPLAIRLAIDNYRLPTNRDDRSIQINGGDHQAGRDVGGIRCGRFVGQNNASKSGRETSYQNDEQETSTNRDKKSSEHEVGSFYLVFIYAISRKVFALAQKNVVFAPSN